MLGPEKDALDLPVRIYVMTFLPQNLMQIEFCGAKMSTYDL